MTRIGTQPDPAAIAQRLQRLVELHSGGKWTKFADACQIPHGTFKNYLDGRRPPDVKALSHIRECFGVSLDWMVFGDEPIHRSEYLVSAPRQPGAVDEEVLADAIEVVDRYLAELEKQGRIDPGKITPAKRAKLVALLYAETMDTESKKPRQTLVERMISLLL
ncbi:MAG TPA: hypothetical protein ENK19_09355 [Acidobacteria bacterium]|nr:hypothetical protein [Acidobacteriota bacterium]